MAKYISEVAMVSEGISEWNVAVKYGEVVQHTDLIDRFAHGASTANGEVMDEALERLDTLGLLDHEEYLLKVLEVADVRVGVDVSTAAYWQLMADNVNWAAKVVHYSFYRLKPLLVARAVEYGAQYGWDTDGVFTLYTPEAGCSCYHDPHGEIEELIPDAPTWMHPWSGIRRQDISWWISEDPKLLRMVAYATRPGKVNSPLERSISKYAEMLDEEWLKQVAA